MTDTITTVDNVYVKGEGNVLSWHMGDGIWKRVDGANISTTNQLKLNKTVPTQDLRYSLGSGQPPDLKTLPADVPGNLVSIEITFWLNHGTSQQASAKGWISTGYVSTGGSAGPVIADR